MIAGGPFYCADGVVGVALTTCMKNSPAVGIHTQAVVVYSFDSPNSACVFVFAQQIDVSYLVQIAKNTEAFGYIDPLSNLAGDKVWMMSATNDTVVATGVVKVCVQRLVHLPYDVLWCVSYRLRACAQQATEAWYNEFVSDASQVGEQHNLQQRHQSAHSVWH